MPDDRANPNQVTESTLPSPGERWLRYSRWNNAVEKELFDGRLAGQPVYLDLEPSQLESASMRAEINVRELPEAALATAVAGTLNLASIGGPFQRHLTALADWRATRQDDAPPCLALLALLSLVAQKMVRDDQLASHNYYGRLCQILGIEDPYDRKLLEKCFRRDTPRFWDALNGWLQHWEGERGLPTARSLDRRKYVSVPISQALLRAQDRLRLRGLFADYQLSPGQRISAAELAIYLNDWTSRGHAGPAITRLWRKGDDLRERITAIACDELEAWSGNPQSTTSSTTHPLLWLAQIRQRPTRAIDLFLVSRGIEEGNYALSAESNEAARRAFAACGSEIRMEELSGAPFTSLEPWNEVAIGELLVAYLALKKIGNTHKLQRSPRTIIVLQLPEGHLHYQEVARAQLLRKIAILCLDGVRHLVEQHLQRVARPGYKSLRPTNIEGLPEGWHVFVDVELMRALDNAPEGLEALQPISDSDIAVDEGLNLGRDTWHERAQPEVRAVAPEGMTFGLVAHELQIFGEKRALGQIDLGSFMGAGAVHLSTRSLIPGDYRISMEVDSRGQRRILGQTSIRIRSADYPRPATLAKHSQLAFHLPRDAALGSLSASEQYTNDDTATVVRGGSIVHDGPSTTSAYYSALPDAPALRGGMEEQIGGRRPGSLAAGSLSTSCLTRNYHYWICEAGTPGDREIKRQECRDCGLNLWVRNRIHRRRRVEARPITIARRITDPPTDIQTYAPTIFPMPTASHAGLDLILDALSYVRSGTWEQLRDLAAHIDDRPWFHHYVGRILFGLGHLDIELDPEKLMRPKHWCVSPSSFVQISPDRAVLTGFRSQKLVDAIASTAETLGGQLEKTKEAAGITVVSILGLDAVGLQLVADEVGQGLGTAIGTSQDFALRLAKSLPRLSDVEIALPSIQLGGDRLERFELRSGNWREVVATDEPGAYRLQWRGVTYGYVSPLHNPDGNLRVADSYTVKYLAARQAMISLVGYDRAHQELLVPLGCELPGLFHRAAILASGRPPKHMQGGWVRYVDVPENIARELVARLTN